MATYGHSQRTALRAAALITRALLRRRRARARAQWSDRSRENRSASRGLLGLLRLKGTVARPLFDLYDGHRTFLHIARAKAMLARLTLARLNRS